MNNRVFRPAALLAALVLLSGCQAAPARQERTVLAMDTVMNLTVISDAKEEGAAALDDAVDTLYALDQSLSATGETGQVYALNHAEGAWTALDGETVELLSQSLELCALTGGALDLTAHAAVEEWGFLTGEYRVPAQTQLDGLIALIDYTQIQVDETGAQAKLPAGMSLDFGAVAKGYAADRLAEELAGQGVEQALLDLGQSTILALGAKENGQPWRIGIQDPAGDGYLGVLELADAAMGTSGSYQRYFEQDGVRYWHIIDPKTASPARSGLASVTVTAPSALLCDGLSTALFVMSQAEGTEFWRAHPELGFDVIFIEEDGSISVTAGLEDAFSLAEGYTDREVTVIAP